MSPRSGARRGTRARARRGRRARRLGMLLAAVAVTAGVVYVGYRGQTPQQTGSSASPSPSASSPTPRIDLSGLPIKREEFCDRLDRGDVALA
ncbi:MAG: hypothetical protein HOQ45_22770, partial [Nocardioidaceae bacterium]|nr:hypothetical protein [Nocardioidaceae bacterium]